MGQHSGVVFSQVYLAGSLSSFRSLRPGWDSYDAEPPNETALENARQVLLLFMDSQSSLPVRVAPSAEGGVALIFSKGDSTYGEILAITSKLAQEPTIWPLTLEEEVVCAAFERIAIFLDA